MGIELSIIAGLCYASSSVNANGSERHAITEEETATFGLDGAALGAAVAACLGRPPDLVQLNGFLHNSHDWNAVRTVLVVQSASVTGVGSEPVNMAITEPGAELTCTCANLWSPTDGVTPDEPIRYGIEFPAGGGHLRFTHDWGENTIESSTLHLPADSAGAELIAMRQSLGVRVVYDAYLTGEVAVHYRDGHRGHRFWALDISTVMAAGGLRNGRHFAENLNIRYHASTRVIHGDGTRLSGPGIRVGADLALVTA